MMAVQIEDAAHIWMGYGTGQVNLVFEPAKRVLVVQPHRLHGYPCAEIQILSLIDLAHAARPDRPHNAVSSRENLAGVQRPGVSRGPYPLAAKQTEVQQCASVSRVAQHPLPRPELRPPPLVRRGYALPPRRTHRPSLGWRRLGLVEHGPPLALAGSH